MARRVESGEHSSADRSRRAAKQVVGWREWIALPDLGIDAIKVKVDTGARTSALHAFDVRTEERAGTTYVRFKVHPVQRDSKLTLESEAELLERRYVRNSGGARTLRPVIQTRLRVGDLEWEAEVTLVARDEMGFRMLIGREAVRRRLLVDPGRSYLLGPVPDSQRKRRSTRGRK